MTGRIRQTVAALMAGFVFLMSRPMRSPAQTLQRGGTIPIEMDVARFRRAEGWTLVEIYFSVPRDAFFHVKTGYGLESGFTSLVRVMQGDSVIAEDYIRITDIAADSVEVLPGRHIANQSSFLLRGGDYTLLLTVTGGQREEGWVKRDFAVRPILYHQLALSDIELALEITPDTAKTRFFKNGYTIVPNPAGIYAKKLPLLCYYSEIYNLKPSPAADSIYCVQWTIEDADGRPAFSGGLKTKPRQYASVVEAGRIPVDGLPGGSYSLVLEAKDGPDGFTVSRRKQFTVYQKPDSSSIPAAGPAPAVLFAGRYASMDEKAIDEAFRQAGYIASADEKKLFSSLTLDGKRAFLAGFWKRRDETPQTPDNSFQAAYEQRVAMADAQFSTGRHPGWRTDQGRILILHGIPDEIERFPSSGVTRAYQLWHYHAIQGGVLFVFVDKQGLGEMSLVHSTERSEVYDDQWERWLQ